MFSLSEYVVIWLYFLVVPSILLGLFFSCIRIYLHLYFIVTVTMIVVAIIKIVKTRRIIRTYRDITIFQIVHVLLFSLLVLIIILTVLYSPLLYNWDAVSIYIPIAKTIVETESLTGPNIYYQTSQTMYAPPLTPILMAFFMSIAGDLGFRIVPIVLSIMMFLVIYDIIKMFVERPIAPALASFFTIVANPFYILYYVKESMYLDLGFIVLTLFVLYETIKILSSHDLQTRQLLLWSIALALLIASKEYGIYVSIAIFTIFITLLIRNRRSTAFDILSTFLFTLPFLLIYLWDIHKLGLSRGVISGLLGSGVLLSIALMSYRGIVGFLSSRKCTWSISAIKGIVIFLLVSSPILLYYIVFALVYGVAGPLNLVWIQQKFIPPNILSLIAPLYAKAKPTYDADYMNFFTYDRVLRSVGGFVAIGSLLVLIMLQLLCTRLLYRGSEDKSFEIINNKVKLKLLILLSLIVVFYYLGAVDISQMLRIVGTEYRRVLPVIAIVNVIAPILASTGQDRQDNGKMLSIWILTNVLLNIVVINIFKTPYSYLSLLSPQKTLVSADVIAVFFGLLNALTILALLSSGRRVSKKCKNTINRSITLVLVAFLVMLVFSGSVIVSWINLLLKYGLDPRWYNTIYSSVVYSPNWGSQWVKVYEFLEDKQNATLLVEGVYPLAYFLNKPIIVYGNPASIWYTTHALLAQLINDTSVNDLYIVRNKDLKKSFSENVFNLVKSILEVDNLTKIRTLITVLSFHNLEVLELKTLKLVYQVNYNNVSLIEGKKMTKYKVLAKDLVEWNITAEKTDWYILGIILPQPLKLSDQCILRITLVGDDSGNPFEISIEDSNGNTRYLYRGPMDYSTAKTFTLNLSVTVDADRPERFNLASVSKIKIAYYKLNNEIFNRILVGAARFYCLDHPK